MFRYVKGGITHCPMPRGRMYNPDEFPLAYRETMHIDIPETDPNSWQATADKITKDALQIMQAANLDVEKATAIANFMGGVFEIRNTTLAAVRVVLDDRNSPFSGKRNYGLHQLRENKYAFGLRIPHVYQPRSYQ
ncbi:hypothetical protein KA036_00750 [Candidatus Gracilibacteria bacterium]|nr:hypothetical protein [Candidatus Gracilibacteria bacterium]